MRHASQAAPLERCRRNSETGGEDIRDFYAALAQVSFTIFGLWLVVVELRRSEWAARPQLRWGAQAAAMHFALPGMMSLLNLADPASNLLWRVSFAGFAALGGVAAVLLDGAAPGAGALRRIVRWGAVALYAAVALVAMFADLVASAFGVHPLQLEAVLLSLLLFLGLNVAFALLFDPSSRTGTNDG